MIFFDKADGYDCPECGCTDTEVVIARDPAQEWFPSGQVHCSACGADFAVKPPPMSFPPGTRSPATSADLPSTAESPVLDLASVSYHPVRCPACRSADVPVYKTSGRVRYHACRNPACKHRFKSVEHS
jgi:hypothetical protein